MSTTKELLTGFGEEKEIASIRKLAMLTFQSQKKWEHVDAHRTEKDKKDMSQFEKFVTEGNKKVDELAKAGAMLDEGFMAEARAKMVKQERGVCRLAVRSELSLLGGTIESEELEPKTEERWIFVDKRR